MKRLRRLEGLDALDSEPKCTRAEPAVFGTRVGKETDHDAERRDALSSEARCRVHQTASPRENKKKNTDESRV